MGDEPAPTIEYLQELADADPRTAIELANRRGSKLDGLSIAGILIDAGTLVGDDRRYEGELPWQSDIDANGMKENHSEMSALTTRAMAFRAWRISFKNPRAMTTTPIAPCGSSSRARIA